MAEVSLKVGGRSYAVACGAGEEDQLQAAARLLDGEVTSMGAAAARLSEGRLMLMSGLMLADKYLELHKRISALEADAAEAEARAADSETRAAAIAKDAVALQDTAVSADAAGKLLERMTARIEALAETPRA